MEVLTRLEELYLLAIFKLDENAYGVTIKNEVANRSGKIVSYGALYYMLDQLYSKGFVNKVQGEPTPVRGGCSKIFYMLTDKGRKALKEAHDFQQSIWYDIPVADLKDN